MQRITHVLFLVFLSLFLCPTFSHAAKTVEELHAIQSAPNDEYEKAPVSLTKKEKKVYEQLKTKLLASPTGAELLRTAKHLKYSFGGFSKSNGEAYTETETRIIYIKKDIEPDLMLLYFAYELSNVINSSNYNDIDTKARAGKITRDAFANKMLLLEAEAGYWQYLVAKELNLLHVDELDFDFIDQIKPTLSIEKKLSLMAEKSKTYYAAGTEIRFIDFYKNQYDSLRREKLMIRVWANGKALIDSTDTAKILSTIDANLGKSLVIEPRDEFDYGSHNRKDPYAVNIKKINPTKLGKMFRVVVNDGEDIIDSQVPASIIEFIKPCIGYKIEIFPRDMA